MDYRLCADIFGVGLNAEVVDKASRTMRAAFIIEVTARLCLHIFGEFKDPWTKKRGVMLCLNDIDESPKHLRITEQSIPKTLWMLAQDAVTMKRQV